MGNSLVRSLFAALLFAGLAATIQAQTITTLAGGGPDNVPATAAAIGTPWGVVQDSNKNTYFSDNLSNRVFKVDSTGKITVLAGDIVPGHISALTDGVPATTAEMDSPTGIALDAAGNVYVADAGNSVVRVIVTQSTPLTLAGQQIPSGNIQVIAGNGTAGYTQDNVAATGTNLNVPGGIWLDSSGNVYIADTLNSRIRVVNVESSTITINGIQIPSGYINTVAGTGVSTFGGDGGPAVSAMISQPLGIFLDATGNIYIADTQNNRIRVVNTQGGSITVAGVSIPAGDIQTVAGSGTEGYDGDGTPATNFELNHPSALFVDGSGEIFIADGDNIPSPNQPTSNERIREVSSSGAISTVAGIGTQCTDPTGCGDGGPATSANLWAPTGVFVDGSGNVFVADQNDDAIREFTVGGNIKTAMGELLNTAYSGDVNSALGVAGTPTDASLRRPGGVISDNIGNVIIADTLNNVIREVSTSSGVISTIAGSGLPCTASFTCNDGTSALSVPITMPAQAVLDGAGNLYFAASGDNLVRVLNNQSSAITFFSNTANQVVVNPGDIFSLAGNGHVCASTSCGDGAAGRSAQLNQPSGLFVDPAGNIYIADTGDNAVRKLDAATGNITTVAGNLNPAAGCPTPTSSCGDGDPATNATVLLNAPVGIALDASGNIYISDTGDNRVRVVDAKTGIINAYAGTGAACQNHCGDGGPAVSAILDAPQGLYIDYAGDVFIADTGDYEIREVTPDGTINAVVDASQTRGFLGDGGSASAALLGLPFGVGGDPFGNLFIADAQEWRVRKVTQTVNTPPRADVSPANLQFSDQGVGSTSAAMTTTLTNSGFGTSLKVTSVAVSGKNSSDFAVSNKCGSTVAAGATCDVDVTFTPTATGSRSATLTINDNAVQGSQQTVALSGTAVVGFTMPSSGALSSPTLSAGGTTTATVTITPQGNFNSVISLTCSVSPSPSLAPTCSLSPKQVTPKGNAAVTSTLTVGTTAATSGALTQPGIQHRSLPVYAIWLVLPAMLLGGVGLSARDRKKLISYMLLALAVTGIVFMVACGGGSSSSGNGGGGGSAGTPAGAYTVTVTATSGSTVSKQTFPLTVQ